MFERRTILLSFFISVLSSAAMAQAPQYTIHDLGSDIFLLNGINNSGQVVGCFSSPRHAFRSTPNGAPNPATDDLGTLGGSTSCAYGINASGQVAGSSAAADGSTHGFRTAANASINPATDDIGTLGLYPTIAYGINDSGRVVGSSKRNSNEAVRAFRTGADTAINPATDDVGALLPAGMSAGKSVNAVGDMEGDSMCATLCNDNTGFVDAGGTVTTGIGVAAPGQSYTGINNRDQVAYNDGGFGHLLVWQNGAITQLADCKSAGLTFCGPRGINDSLQVVGSVSQPNVPFLYTRGAIYDLNTLIPAGTGWQLELAVAINDTGQIIGRGTLSGVLHFFRLDPVLTPAAAISQILDLVSSSGLPRGEMTALQASLNAALTSFNAGDIPDAMGALTAFKNKVRAQAGVKLTIDQANQLMAAAEAAIQAM